MNRQVRDAAVAAALAAVLLAPSLQFLMAGAAVGDVLAVGLVVACAAGALLYARSRRSNYVGDEGGGEAGGDADAEGDAEAGGDVWDLIPSWQYAGRHVESGGLARDEQERALRDARERAAAVERLRRER